MNLLLAGESLKGVKEGIFEGYRESREISGAAVISG
jgi:hypothetical protein